MFFKTLTDTAVQPSPCVVQPLTEKARKAIATWRMQLQRGVVIDVLVGDFAKQKAPW